jgi:predicted 3-demethylubiquinone-9 3-methyltransferase (glyoxalase superfamily)
MPNTYPCPWFDIQAQEAAEFYTSLFPNSRIGTTTNYPKGSGEREGQVLTVAFELDGAPYLALDGGSDFTFTEAISITIDVADQAELDRYWDALIADGGQEGPCGWLKDRFGLSWQVIPSVLGRYLGDSDRTKANRVMQAMMQMRKIVIADLDKAYAG